MPEIQPETQSETQEVPRHQCRHIHASGHRCGSPSLKLEPFCYFHHASRAPIPPGEIDRRRCHQSVFQVPSLEDRTAIQSALTEVLNRIATHDLDPRRAGLLLYGLQIAACNLPKPTAAAHEMPLQIVDELIQDPHHGPIAPEQEFQSAPREKTLEQILLEQWHKDGEERAIQEQEDALLAEKRARMAYDYALPADAIVDEIPLDPGLTIQATADPTTDPRSTPNSYVLKILHQIPRGTPTPSQAVSSQLSGSQLSVQPSLPLAPSPQSKTLNARPLHPNNPRLSYHAAVFTQVKTPAYNRGLSLKVH